MSISERAIDDQAHDDLEARLAALEKAVVTLTAAVDASSRVRISSIHPNLRIAGGKRVRRILEKGGLVEGYPEGSGLE